MHSLTMEPVSSPIVYPSSSSPPRPFTGRKRPLAEFLTLPSKRLNAEGDTSQGKGNETAKDVPLVNKHVHLQTTRGPKRAPAIRLPFLDDDDEGTDCIENDGRSGLLQDGIARKFPSASASLQAEMTEAINASSPETRSHHRSLLQSTTSNGKIFSVGAKVKSEPVSFERLIGQRSVAAPGEAVKSFYGVNIHHLIDQAGHETQSKPQAVPNNPVDVFQSPDPHPAVGKNDSKPHNLLWTEKYRAKKFIDLVGDERTHRDVLRWLKGWDPVVFPGSAKRRPLRNLAGEEQEQKSHRKILMLTGPPGLGKTTLAHVCARQAGYEVLEINASDDRSREVVKGRIRDCVGTDNVKGINTKTDGRHVRKVGRPFCVIVDEVDGVVSGSSGSGEGGFIKALIDLVALDQKNAVALGATSGNVVRAKKKGDRFRLLRPMILICNDVYHPALRPFRASSCAEIIHVNKPPLDKVISRLRSVFDKEGLPCDADGVRRLCEATWGLGKRQEQHSQSSGTGEGDMRSIFVVGEWVASKLRAAPGKVNRLTRRWVEDNILSDLAHGGGGARGIGRGGAKEAAKRVFQEGAGFLKTETATAQTRPNLSNKNDSAQSASGTGRSVAMSRLQEIVEASGESDRIIADCFTSYPSQSFHDDTFLSKPDAAYDWLHFHDRLSARIHTGHEWELGGYLSQPVLGLHHLFASSSSSWSSNRKYWEDDTEQEPTPFSGSRADYEAFEITKQNKAVLSGLQSSLSIPLLRSFRSIEAMAMDLIPYLARMLIPDVKPILVGSHNDQGGVVSFRKEGEREKLARAVSVMSAVGVTFEKTRIDTAQSGMSNYIYRMEPPLDTLSTFETSSQKGASTAPVRYAIRQALDAEHQKLLILRSKESRQARFEAGRSSGAARDDEDENPEGGANDAGTETLKGKALLPKRDFFGRIIDSPDDLCGGRTGGELSDSKNRQMSKAEQAAEDRRVWVSFHEGYSNAVRKPITLDELLKSF